jgi:midasin
MSDDFKGKMQDVEEGEGGDEENDKGDEEEEEHDKQMGETEPGADKLDDQVRKK